MVKQYFYLKAREKIIANKKYLKEAIKNRLIENEIAKIETTAQIENNVSLCINNHPEATNSHGKQYTPVRSEKEGISCYKERENVDAYEEESNITANDEVEEHNVEFESMFKKLDPAKKWYLSTGKCMDDELFMFDLQCESDHPSRSLIADPYDKNYILYNVFTQEELQEIMNYQKKSLPKPSDSLKLFFKPVQSRQYC